MTMAKKLGFSEECVDEVRFHPSIPGPRVVLARKDNDIVLLCAGC